MSAATQEKIVDQRGKVTSPFWQCQSAFFLLVHISKRKNQKLTNNSQYQMI